MLETLLKLTANGLMLSDSASMTFEP